MTIDVFNDFLSKYNRLLLQRYRHIEDILQTNKKKKTAVTVVIKSKLTILTIEKERI